mmetsp:Transcript_134878/g.190668  ORF Transcript_134878/g.190668 Transcript_134878/m.190668 type:complete len:147 (-) Transcript_134878:141-581(-)|eukprot:s1708_g17.t1
MPMCEPENTEISRTIEKELLNQVDESWALQRKKALKDLYVGNPPPVGRTCAVERPSTPKWLFRGHQYHGIKTKEERDHRVLNELAAERVAQAKQLPSGPGSRTEEELSESRATQRKDPPPGFGGGTMQDWAKHMKALPGGRNWLDR